MNAQTALNLARKHVANNATMESSARLCLADAVSLYDKADYDLSIGRALKSLGYSVGVFHADYKRVASFITSKF